MSVFRGQLVLEEQRRLFDVWRDAAGAADMPTRQAFQPRAFSPLLPFVSLVDVSETGAPKVRVAGSALRDILGADPATALLCPLRERSGGLDAQQAGGGWLSIARVMSEAKPACGLAPQAPDGARVRSVRAWLRLPLGRDGRVEAVIGLDLCLAGTRAPVWALERMAAGGRPMGGA